MVKIYPRSLGIFLAMFLATSLAWAQERTVSGTVSDPAGEPLPGANVLVKGSQRGTIADADGKYQIKLQAEDKVLVFSFVGFERKTVKVGDRKVLNVSLKEQRQLDEVVITALDMKRSEEALGYSVQTIDKKDIAEVKENNITNKLAGRVAGVYVSGSGNGPTASANITIRGQTSLNGSSQPLFVVNGMPISNGLFSPGDGLNGSTTIDFGNSAQVINPDDVESISVLKGPAAAALYGSRAASGVILITTKKGSDNQGWSAELNTQTMFQSILKRPDFQDEYGFGGYGFYSYRSGDIYTSQAVDYDYNGDGVVDNNDAVNYYDAFGENWGPRMDGQNIKQFDSSGEPVPFNPAPDNFNNFFRTGIVNTNNISISQADDKGDFRMSFTNMNNRGIVPNTDLTRNTVYTSLGRKLFDQKLEVRLNAFNIRNQSGNVPNGGYDESSSIMYGWLWYPRQVAIEDLKPYWRPGQVGEQQRYVEELWVNNPWLVANENTNSFQENRTIGNLMARYLINENLNVRVRFGADYKDEQRQFRRATSTKALPGQYGSYREDDISFWETNTEAVITYKSNAFDGSKFDYDLKLGGNLMRQESNILTANNPQLLLPGEFTLTNNRTDILVDNPRASKAIYSVFGLASLSYDSWLYMDITGRNDWSSTLPSDNNSYFYPSVSFSGVISDKLKLAPSSWLTFLKLRVAYAEVGSDTDPFLLRNTYRPQPLFGSQPAFTNNSFATNPNLRPERTTSWEFGADARFWDNLVGVDVTYYDMLSRDQIIFLPTAVSSGKETRLTNAGEIRSRGVEALIRVTPIRNENFSWTTVFNIGHNAAIVERLPAGVQDNYPIVADVFPTDGGSQDLELVAVEGEKLGQLRGLGFQRDDQGRIIHENGLPLLTEEKVNVGSYQPDARLGWQNILTYKSWTFSFLFDGQIGGNIYSRGHALFNTGGTITNENDPNLDLTTLEGRAEYDISYNSNGDPVYTLRPGTGAGVVGPGVKYDANGNLVENDVAVPTRDYFYAYYGNGFNRDNIEAATYDATWFKLREVRLTYQMPQKWFEGSVVKGLTVSLIGRNLLLFTNVPTIDPETFSIRNGLFINGFGSNPLPSVRSYGFSVSARF